MDQLQERWKNELLTCVMMPVHARAGLKKRCSLGAHSASWVSLGYGKTFHAVPYHITSYRITAANGPDEENWNFHLLSSKET